VAGWRLSSRVPSEISDRRLPAILRPARSVSLASILEASRSRGSLSARLAGPFPFAPMHPFPFPGRFGASVASDAPDGDGSRDRLIGFHVVPALLHLSYLLAVREIKRFAISRECNIRPIARAQFTRTRGCEERHGGEDSWIPRDLFRDKTALCLPRSSMAGECEISAHQTWIMSRRLHKSAH
jgi:hypothetical protein